MGGHSGAVWVTTGDSSPQVEEPGQFLASPSRLCSAGERGRPAEAQGNGFARCETEKHTGMFGNRDPTRQPRSSGHLQCCPKLRHPGKFQGHKSQATSAGVPGHRPQNRCRAGPLPPAATCPVLLICSWCFSEAAPPRGRPTHTHAKCSQSVPYPLSETQHVPAQRSVTFLRPVSLGETFENLLYKSSAE